MNLDLMSIVGFLGGLASELTMLVYAVSLVMGVYFVMSAIFDVISKGDDRRQQMSSNEASWAHIGIKLVVASLLVTFATTLDLFVSLSDGSQVRSALAYTQASSGSNPVTSAVWGAIKLWCLFVGAAGFLRGWVILVAATKGGHDGGDKFWQALWHIVGGSLVVNIFG